MYVTKGSGIHSVDFVHYEVEPDRMFLMTPGQVHTWKLSDGIDGFVIFFTAISISSDLLITIF
jgi:quercetin dioxygenase-like cupin family protein